MNKSFVFLFLALFSVLRGEPYPHLILHMDVNKTLIASDKTENKSLRDVINEMLSRKYSACWDETVLEPISFDLYVKTVLMPGKEHDVALKMARLVHLTHFVDYLQEREHPLFIPVLQELEQVMSKLEHSTLFPSFYRLIDYLDAHRLSYTLFLRSFGQEVFEIKEEINKQLKPFFEQEATFQGGILKVGEAVLQNPEAIYAFFCTKTHAAVRDDWSYWMKGEMFAKYGKPFYLDLENREILPLFFDDNIKVNSFEKNVVAPLDAKTGKPLSIASLLESKQMIFVDTLQAIENENYFIEKIEEALLRHQETASFSMNRAQDDTP